MGSAGEDWNREGTSPSAAFFSRASLHVAQVRPDVNTNTAVSFVDAAALPVAAATAYDGVRQLALPPGATLLILQGAGHDLPRPLWDVFVPALLQHTGGGRP